MKTPGFLALLIPRNKFVSGSITFRNIICAIFIVLIALFLTSPEPRSTFDKPLPLPAELGLE